MIENVLLDLDETLISAIPLDEFDPSEYQDRMKKFKHHNMDNVYLVFERPHVQEFLDYLFKHYNVSVWTAATKSYALFIIDNVVLQKPGRKLDFIMYSDHCEISEYKSKCSKQLNELFHLNGYNYSNTVIVDDNENVNRQKNHTIQIKPFEVMNAGSEDDDALMHVLETLSEMN
jgi:TFIIF-interacting CTD phosphatase-like protein